MKTRKIGLTFAVFLFLASFLVSASSQPRGYFRGEDFGPGQYCQFIPDLTEEQEKEISSIRTEQLSESTRHRAKMAELRAQKRSLMLEARPDEQELNDVIDQMTELRNKQLKRNVAHRQKIRELLTDEQRVYFENLPKMRKGRHPGMRDGRAGRPGGRGMPGRGMHRTW